MGVADTFYSIATGPERRRTRLTPLGLVLFVTLFILVVAASLATDQALNLPPLLPGPRGLAVGAVLLAVGLPLWAWCVALFLQGGGTPVPFNPPPTLVARGPYRRVRNPMLEGVFASLFGLGFLLHSASMVLIWTPIYLIANLIEITRVEQPELERRFGAAYREYRRRVPMLIPSRQRADRRRGPSGLPC
jgi:protein-S-isoprenylcysteine O-methyltransferase Ste14